MDELGARRLVAGAPQQRRPDHRVELEDVLGQQVDVGRPVAPLEVVAGPGVGQGRDVVDQRVDPDVDHLLGIPRHGDAPGDRLAADGDVVEAALDERQGLVVTRPGPHPVGVLEVEPAQPILVARQQKVVVLFFEPHRLGAVHRAVTVDEVALVVEALAGRTVEAAVGALLDVAGGPQLLDEALHEGLVLGIGRANEEIVRGVHPRGHLAKLRGEGVDVLARGQPALLGRLGDLVAVFVGAGQKEDIVAEPAMVAGQDVGGDRGVGVPEVRVGVDVIDRRGDEVAAHLCASPCDSLSVNP